MPARIQRQRTAGWRMPEGAVYVGRPTKFGNPWRLRNAPLNHPDPHRWLVEQYVEWAARLDVTELAGRDLACWCSLDQPCHADVLLELANPAEVHRVA